MPYEIDFRRLRRDLQALAEQFDEEELRGGCMNRYDYRKVKALAACYELWGYVASRIDDDEIDDG